MTHLTGRGVQGTPAFSVPAPESFVVVNGQKLEHDPGALASTVNFPGCMIICRIVQIWCTAQPESSTGEGLL
jgi:hypothetical protein